MSEHPRRSVLREGFGFLASVFSGLSAAFTLGKSPLRIAERVFPNRPLVQIVAAAPFSLFAIVSVSAFSRGIVEGAFEAYEQDHNNRVPRKPT
eukprot:ANDGO_01598.mRNA.1 hypothetical protein